jgi:hypothetical protein
MREAMLPLTGFVAGEAGEGSMSPFATDRFMPARARVTEGSPSRGSCECCEAAAEETADGTGEGESGVMCGGSFWEGGGGEREMERPEKKRVM